MSDAQRELYALGHWFRRHGLQCLWLHGPVSTVIDGKWERRVYYTPRWLWRKP